MMVDKVNPLENEKISYAIVRQFVHMIKEGDLKAGDRLPPERDLTKHLGVSRASLREALSALSVIGVLKSSHGAGTYIGDFNLSEFIDIIAPLLIQNDKMEEDMLDFRRMLELDALRLTFESKSKDTSVLRRQIDIMKKALETEDIDMSVQADINFHKHFFAMSGNHVLQQVYKYVRIIMEKSVSSNVSKIIRKDDNIVILYNQHKALCYYIENNQAENAEALLREHLDFVKTVN